jgi:predicted Zn-dependent protease
VRQGRTNEAITHLKAAVEADPKNTAAQQALTQALVGGGRAGEKTVTPTAD